MPTQQKGLAKMHEEDNAISVPDYKSRAGGLNVTMTSALGSYQGWQEIEVAVDSGACETVMPQSLSSVITLRESEQQMGLAGI